jgi:hypothetical protein
MWHFVFTFLLASLWPACQRLTLQKPSLPNVSCLRTVYFRGLRRRVARRPFPRRRPLRHRAAPHPFPRRPHSHPGGHAASLGRCCTSRGGQIGAAAASHAASSLPSTAQRPPPRVPGHAAYTLRSLVPQAHPRCWARRTSSLFVRAVAATALPSFPQGRHRHAQAVPSRSRAPIMEANTVEPGIFQVPCLFSCCLLRVRRYASLVSYFATAC